MNQVRVFLAGEGRNELGGLAQEAPYADETPGVIESLLRRVRKDGWVVAGAIRWKHIRKYRARGPAPTEEHNVLGVVYEAHRAKADVVAFIRDADNDPGRQATIDSAILKASREFALGIVGGTAVRAIEAWMLALLGIRKSEHLAKPTARAKLGERGVSHTAAMVEVVSKSDLARVPSDAKALRAWLRLADEILGRHCSGQA